MISFSRIGNNWLLTLLYSLLYGSRFVPDSSGNKQTKVWKLRSKHLLRLLINIYRCYEHLFSQTGLVKSTQCIPQQRGLFFYKYKTNNKILETFQILRKFPTFVELYRSIKLTLFVTFSTEQPAIKQGCLKILDSNFCLISTMVNLRQRTIWVYS